MEEPFAEELRRIGAAIRAARVKTGENQDEFGDRAGIHRTYVGAIERGEPNVSWENISRVCRALGLKPSAMLKRAGL